MVLNLSVLETNRQRGIGGGGEGASQVGEEHTEYLHSFCAAVSLIAVELPQKKNASNDCQIATDGRNDAVHTAGT